MTQPDLYACGSGNLEEISNSSEYKVRLTLDVTNQGSSSAGSSYVGYYLLSEEYLRTGTGNTYFLGEDYVRSLNAGETSTETITVDMLSLNPPDDTYHFALFVDYTDQVEESEEGNNGCYWDQTTFTFPLYVVFDEDAPEKSASSGLKSIEINQPKLQNAPRIKQMAKENPISLSNAPNPASFETDILFTLAKESKVTLLIKDLQGRTLAQLINQEPMTAGDHRMTYDVSQLTPGMYICVLRTGETQQVHKLIVAGR